jgi:DNA-binding PadR family transcriptional regulator
MLRLNPLALAVLELLKEGPKHPYEMQRLINERGISQVINVRPSSVYSAVARLAKIGCIEQTEVNREGRRPERTVYRITKVGVDRLLDGLRALLSDPGNEFPAFAAGLAFIAVLPEYEAVRFLEWRISRLEAEIQTNDGRLAGLQRTGADRLFTLEREYIQAMKRAELEVVRGVVEDINGGRLAWPARPSAMYETDTGV